MQLAEETGIYLDVTGLGCYHKQDVPAWYDAMDESDRWKVQARFWRAVAEVCKESPAIFCYDLMNEPIPSGDRKGDWLPGQPMGGSYFVQRLTTDMRGRTEQEVAKEWIAEMSAAIRAVDQRHMITVGLVVGKRLLARVPSPRFAIRMYLRRSIFCAFIIIPGKGNWTTTWLSSNTMTQANHWSLKKFFRFRRTLKQRRSSSAGQDRCRWLDQLLLGQDSRGI